MQPHVVKILFNDDGDKVDKPVWHLVKNHGSGQQAFCTGEYFGFGEGSAVFKEKHGRVTCEDCIEIIREIQKIKL